MSCSIARTRKQFRSFIASLPRNDIIASPNKDFTRHRKFTLFSAILLLLTMAGHSLNHEFDDFFLPERSDIPSKSAFVQLRHKFSKKAFQKMLAGFNVRFPFQKLYKGTRKNIKGLHLLACDGSDINIPSLPGDKENFTHYNSRKGGFYQIHLTALYDLCEKRYADAIISCKRALGENDAFCTMADRNTIGGRILYIADRGFTCFNNFAHIIRAGQYFLIRSKANVAMNLFPKGSAILEEEEFDVVRKVVITRKYIKKPNKDPSFTYRWISPRNRFDYIAPDDKVSTFSMQLRVVKVKINEGNYEYLMTNLPERDYPVRDLKELYRLRWGIETSFRTLKHSVALAYFHSIKREFIEQEVFARLIMYNFISLTAGKIEVPRNDGRKYEYRISFSDAVSLGRKLLLCRIGADKYKAQLLKRSVPVRPDRNFERPVRSQRLKPLNNRA